MEEFDRVANEKKDLHRFSRRKALLQRPKQGRSTLPRRRQRHRRDPRTHWIQTGCTVEKGNMTIHSLDPDAAQWSSWSSGTWSPSTRSSWWDYSFSLQSWRHSHHDQPQLTSQQTSWTVEHVLQNTSTGRPGVERSISRNIFESPIEEWHCEWWLLLLLIFFSGKLQRIRLLLLKWLPQK